MKKIYRSAGLIKWILWILTCAAIIQSVWTECGHFEWECDNGDCIEKDQTCDGTTDCKDLSDEIAENCIHRANKCHRFSFTCSYGACVPGLYRCNNATNCADNSDELVCLNSDRTHHQGECGADKMQCLGLNRECVERDVMCDGRKDCSDGSDEKVEVCAGIKCPPWTFQCGYGACVAGNAKCNGTAECADDSDEAWQLCGTARKPRTALLPVTPQSLPVDNVSKSDEEVDDLERRYRGGVSSGSEEDDGKRCKLPLDRPQLNFKLHPQNDPVKPGSEVEDYEIVHVECLNGTYSVGSLYCKDGNFDSDFPKCKFCDKKKLEGISTKYEIVFNGTRINASTYTEGIPVGSTVEVTCRPGFKGNTQRIKCLEDATFNKMRESCKHDCGTRVPFIKPLIQDGKPTTRSALPWHVAIYKKDDSGKFEYKCGGTILSPSIVVSAAHCFPNTINITSLNNYSIVAGKFYRDYYNNSGTTVQSKGAKEIRTDGYNEYNYYKDISVITLDSPLLYDEMTSAACPPKEKKNAAIDVADNTTVYIAGFNERTKELNHLQLKTISYHVCKRNYIENGLADDKFCLNINGDGSVCHGDSGNGILERVDEKYYMLGVLSNMYGGLVDCARNGPVAVTNTGYYDVDIFKEKVHKRIEDDEKLF